MKRYSIKIVNIGKSKLVLPDESVNFVQSYLVLGIILYFTLLDIYIYIYIGSRDISVGIATGYGLGGPGIESRSGTIFSAPVYAGPGALPASNTIATGSFPGVNRLGRAVDNPPHLASRLKKE